VTSTRKIIQLAVTGMALLIMAPAGVHAQANHPEVVSGTCNPISHTAEGKIGADLKKHRSQVYCDTAVITPLGDYRGHLLVQFSEKEPHHAPPLGFAGRMEPKDTMQVEHVYLQPGIPTTVSDGECQFFWSDDRKRLIGISCGMKLDKDGRRTVAFVAFDVK